MKMRFFTLLVLFVSVSPRAFSFSGNYIEFDLNKGEIKLAGFSLGPYSLSGDFSLKSYQEHEGLISEVEGRNVVLSASAGGSPLSFTNKVVPWFRLRLKKSGGMLFLENFSLPNISVKGNIDLAKGGFSLDISGQWDEDSRLLNGHLDIFAKAWGNKASFLLSGPLTLVHCLSQGTDFSHIRLDFLGKPPLLNITDSEFVLANGTVAAIEGERFLDLRDFSNLIPGAEFKVRKAFIDEWQVYSQGKDEVGLKKNLDENIGISLGADKNQTNSGPQTELLYRMSEE